MNRAPPLPQLFTAEETILIEKYRACCPQHQQAIELMVEALSKRCATADNPKVLPFIKTGR